MKKVYTGIAFFLAVVVQANSQNLQPQNATLYLQGDPSMLLEAHVDIYNSANATLDVVAERAINNLATNHISYFCWGITCYGPGTSLAPPEPISSGTANSSFRGYASASGTAGITYVTYCFYDQTNLQDSICMEFVYDFTATGINDKEAEKNYLSEPSPNPSAGFTQISYRLVKPAADVQIVLNNMLGATVKKFKMNGVQKTFLLNTSALKPGLYFYSLVAERNILVTKKLIVSGRQ